MSSCEPCERTVRQDIPLCCGNPNCATLIEYSHICNTHNVSSLLMETLTTLTKSTIPSSEYKNKPKNSNYIIVLIVLAMVAIFCILIVVGRSFLNKKTKQLNDCERQIQFVQEINRDTTPKKGQTKSNSGPCLVPRFAHPVNVDALTDRDYLQWNITIPSAQSIDFPTSLHHKYLNIHEELNPDCISCASKIGRGNYGQVLKGNYRKAISQSGIEVAMKTPNSNTLLSEKGEQEIACLKHELRVLLYIGHHSNVVKLIGAMTKLNKFGQYVIVNEYCEFGDLLKYIEERKLFHDVITLTRPAAGFVHKHNFLKIVNLEKPLQSELNSILERNCLCYSALLLYALQIANGAYYYTHCKTVIHRDLALRNIFLTTGHVVKIGDFGLAVNQNEYEVKSLKPLPTPWLAPESLKNKNAIFTAKSDVWSYGVILWELFSLADSVWEIKAPKDPKDFRKWLVHGRRYKFPQYASKSICHLMSQCWQLEPENRPNFLRCRSEIEKSLISYSSDVYNYIKQKIGLNIS